MVSVVIPVYNGERFIADCLESVLAQTYTNMEILLCDDASTDGSYDVVRQYSDPRIQWLPVETNLGQARNLNRGIRQARGDFICWLNQDDLFLPEKVEQQLAEFERRPELGAVFTQNLDLDIDLNPIQTYNPRNVSFKSNAHALRLFLNKGSMLIALSMMVRREVFEKVGWFNESYKIAFDFDMWLRILKHFPIQNITTPLVIYRHHEGNTSQDPKNRDLDRREFSQVFKDAVDRLEINDLLPDFKMEGATPEEQSACLAEAWISVAQEMAEEGNPNYREILVKGFLDKARFASSFTKTSALSKNLC